MIQEPRLQQLLGAFGVEDLVNVTLFGGNKVVLCIDNDAPDDYGDRAGHTAA